MILVNLLPNVIDKHFIYIYIYIYVYTNLQLLAAIVTNNTSVSRF